MVSPRIEGVGAEPREGSTVARSSGYRPRDRGRFMNSTPASMRSFASTLGLRSAPQSGVARRGPARRSPLDTPSGPEPLERTADRRLYRCGPFATLRACEPGAAILPSIAKPTPSRCWGTSIAWKSWSIWPGPPMSSWLFRASPARTSGPELTQLINSDVVVHWVFVDSARVDLGSLTTASSTTTWSLHSASPAIARPLQRATLGPTQLDSRTSKGSSTRRFAAVALVVLAPLFALVAVAILVTTGRPIFYTQERVGQGGRRFRIIKFRSMRCDAETATGPIWASDHDTRCTRIGDWLRHTNIDELPQLFNVLAWGDEPGRAAAGAAELRRKFPPDDSRLRPAACRPRRDDGLGASSWLAWPYVASQADPVRPGLYRALVARAGSADLAHDRSTCLLGQDLVERIQAVGEGPGVSDQARRPECGGPRPLCSVVIPTYNGRALAGALPGKRRAASSGRSRLVDRGDRGRRCLDGWNGRVAGR